MVALKNNKKNMQQKQKIDSSMVKSKLNKSEDTDSLSHPSNYVFCLFSCLTSGWGDFLSFQRVGSQYRLPQFAVDRMIPFMCF